MGGEIGTLEKSKNRTSRITPVNAPRIDFMSCVIDCTYFSFCAVL